MKTVYLQTDRQKAISILFAVVFLLMQDNVPLLTFQGRISIQ